ncbi:FtsX-like permease family protein [Candidatus Binatus sp.]|uniref:FtsX-like permease family protein n=1 Tax=Candidatus Binatus sp. TaxID=2811406 RepID=UPI003C76590A
MRYELKIALRYLRARRKDAFISITTIFTAVGVMIGVAALTMTLSVMGGFEQSIKERVLNLSPQVQILNSRGSIENYGDIEKKVATVPGVNGAEAYIIGQAMLSSGRGIGGVVVRGVEPNNPVVRAQWGRYMTAGGLDDLSRSYTIPAGAAGPAVTTGGLAIGVSLAKKLKAKRGDAIRMVAPIVSPDGSLSTKSGQFVVGAIFDSGMNFIDTNMVFMNLTNAQDFFGRSAKVDGVDIHLVSLDQTDAVTDALTQMFPSPYRVQNWIQFNESAAAGFALLKRVYALVLVMLIGVAAFNLVATLIMVVMEKRKDIAVLIAMGATRRDVRLIFVLKGLIVGAAGTAAGLILGAAGCFALAHYQFIHIPREIYGISTLPIAVAPSNFAAVALASMLLCLLATVYPARQASREMPVEIFRS